MSGAVVLFVSHLSKMIATDSARLFLNFATEPPFLLGARGAAFFSRYLFHPNSLMCSVKWPPPSRQYWVEFKRVADHMQRNGAAPVLFLLLFLFLNALFLAQ